MSGKPTGRRGIEAHVSDAAAAWIARRDVGLTPAEEAELASWLAEKSEHRAAFSFWEDTWERLDRPFELGHAARLQAELELRVLARKRRQTIKLAAATASIALLLTCVGVWRASVPGPETSAPALAGTTLMLPVKQTLPDGTIVELNDGARISVDYSAAARRVVLLAGEAHFDVVPDVARPFYVNAGGVDVRAVGTAFSVQLAPREVAVLVTHGRVAVSRGTAGPEAAAREPAAEPVVHNTQLATLEAGERVVVERHAQPKPAPVALVSSAEREQLLAWRVRRVEFSGTSLAEAVTLLNRHAAEAGGPRFVIADRSLDTVRLSGLFRLAHTEAFVQLLQRGFGIVAERTADNGIVLRRAPRHAETNRS